MKGIKIFCLFCLIFKLSVMSYANLFEMGMVDYFNEKPKNKKKEKVQPFLLWSNADKNIPQPLLKVLNEPNENNARAYIKWNQMRQERLKKVGELIDRVSHEKSK